ncbi:RNA polymerase sigma factor [Piscinibacter sakaiensis]|uniref:RNA polymerase sigma factor n=1 Tax=Piscinibacter sakaiensis TaxID=1547922 RepID=UPI003AAD3024
MAFRNLYQQTSARLYAVVRRIVWLRDEADQVLQEVYLKIWRHAGDFDGSKAQPLTWMHRIAHNHAVDHLRRDALRVGLTATPQSGCDVSDPLHQAVDGAPLPDEHLNHVEELQQVQRLLDTLGARQRQVLVMSFCDGLSHNDIATHLGVPLGSVKSWMRRGLQQVRSAIEQQQGR